MRRRSLLQHGVATRPVLPNDARQSLPSQARLEDPFSSIASPKPLAYLASLKAGDMPRVETPDELGYRHTGAYKLGSLVITNGVASPTPSVERAATMGGEDYISAGNLRLLREGHRREASNRSNTMSIAGERIKSQWVVHNESPLRKASEFDVVSPKLPDLNRSLANFDFDYTHQLQQQMQMHSPTRSQDLANEYIEEISSPYSFVPSRTPSPRLEPTSKHTALEDELFDAESLTPSLSHAPSTADSGYGGPSRKSSAVGKKPLAKADSGYSSNISLRSFKTNGSRAPPVPAKDVPRTPPRDLRDPSRAISYSGDENVEPSDSHSNHHAPFNRQASEKSIPPKTPTKEQQAQAPRRPSLADVRSYSKHSRSGSDPKPLAVSKLSSKKAKPRPYSVQPEMSQIFTQSQRRDEPINAPPIPYEASRSLQDRDNSFHNFLPRRIGSRETLGTIFSVGSGYTDVPRGQELTKSRLQEALPAPPTPLRKAISFSNTSTNNSNSYQPPKTPPRKLQKKPSVQDMIAYQQLDLTVTRKVSHLSIRSSIDDTLDPRSSVASDMKVETAKVMTVRNVSAESGTSIALTHKHSYGSIAARNPYDSRKSSLDTLPSALNKPTSSQPQIRKSSLDSLPSRQAPRKGSVDSNSSRVASHSLGDFSDSLPTKPLDHLTVAPETVRRLSWGSRDKKPPPVSMQTQRKVTPVPQPTYNIFPSPPRRPHPSPLTPISKDSPNMSVLDIPPPVPQKSPLLPPLSAQEVLLPPLLPSHQDSPRDPWADQKAFWSERRESTDNNERPSLTSGSSTNSFERPNLTTRSSTMSTNRNSTSTIQSRGGRRPPSVHQNSNLKIQKNMEAVKARMYMENKMYMQSTPGLRDGQYGAEEQARQSRERDKAGEMLAGWTLSPGGTTPGEYHHTYGFQIPAPPHRAPSPEKEYFSQQEESFNYGDYHQRQSSTADMLMLDGFSGGLDYGLGGRGKESRQRKSVRVSGEYGVDFSDVPLYLARTPDGLRG